MESVKPFLSFVILENGFPFLKLANVVFLNISVHLQYIISQDNMPKM